MSNHSEEAKQNYRNWVRGALAYKYLKQGLEGFADVEVQLEHERILNLFVPGSTCKTCSIQNLKPLHTCKKNHTGRNKCPIGQPNCNCLHRQKQPCPNKFCDVVMEEIFRCHGSTPPTPNWTNTEIQKWGSHPWEIAKCYINARGYSNKTKAADIDAAGLLHIFINNINLSSIFSQSKTQDILFKIRNRRNDIFHSSTMELEDIELDECIDDMTTLLKDTENLKERKDVKEAVIKLEQLKRENFIITTKSEVDVCTDALESIDVKADELKQVIVDAQEEIDEKQSDSEEDVCDKTNCTEDDFKKENDNQSLKQMLIALQSRITSIEGDNIVFRQDTNKSKQIRNRRNDIFHSSTMELEDIELDECIDDMTTLLKDTENLKERKDVKEAVIKLEQLKRENFIITTKSEVDVCTDALESIDVKADELKQVIVDAQEEIDEKQSDSEEDVCDKTNCTEDDFKKENDNQSLKQMLIALQSRITSIEGDNIVFRQDTNKSKQRLLSVENKVYMLEDAKERCARRLKFVQDKQALQDGLVKLYQRYYVKTSIAPLKCNDNDIDIDEVYIEPRMEIKTKSFMAEMINIRTRPCVGYHDIFQTETRRKRSIYISGDIGTGKSSFCKKMMHTWCTAVTDVSGLKVDDTEYLRSKVTTTNSHDFNRRVDENLSSKGHTSDESISSCEGDFAGGTHFTSESQVNDRTPFHDKNETPGLEVAEDSNCSTLNELAPNDGNLVSKSSAGSTHENDINDDVIEMRKFKFLFYIPLQRMTGFNELTDMVKAITRSANLASDELISDIFREESRSCLILADGLDEWNSPKTLFLPLHVSDGLPIRDKTGHATVLTLTRPSAKGMLNMKSYECDQRIDILGIYDKSVDSFISKYLKKYNKPELSVKDFMKKMDDAKLRDLEKTPLFLLQYLWLYRFGTEFGRTRNETYSHLLNTMLAWLQNKDRQAIDLYRSSNAIEEIRLPRILQKFPRCESYKQILFSVARCAFEVICTDIGSCTFGRLFLQKHGLTQNDVATLIKLGILVEENCLDPTEESTKFGFVHTSYLEYFVSVYISTHCCEGDVASNSDSRERVVSVLETLFTKCKSVAAVIKISNILKMTCELLPLIISDLSILISNIVNKDEGVGKFRRFLPDRTGIADSEPESFKIQTLILDDLLGEDSENQRYVSLSDVFISNGREFSCLDRIIHESIVFLFIDNCDKNEIWERMLMLTHLQFMHISHCTITEKAIKSLVSVIEGIPLKCISLYFLQSTCEKQYINASKNDQLQSLDLRHCDSLEFSVITPICLQTARIDSYGVLPVNLLQNATNLSDLHLGEFHSLSFQFSKTMNCILNTLTGLKRLCVEYAHIDENALTVSNRMNHLELIELRNIEMTRGTWLTFSESLITLTQSVLVHMLDCSPYGQNYVLLKTDTFEVIVNDALSFQFRRKDDIEIVDLPAKEGE